MIKSNKEVGINKRTPIKHEMDGGSEIPKGMRKKAYWFCYLMLIPAFYGLIKYVIVNFSSIAIAFTVKDMSGNEIFSPNNFLMLWDEFHYSGSVMMIALGNTMKYFWLGIFKTFLSFLIAYFLYKKLVGNKFFAFAFFLPSIISPIISIMIFKSMIGKYGPIWVIMNTIFHIDFPELLASSESATNVILWFVLILGGFGSTFLLLLGAMKRLPEEMIEAGQMDGVTQWREFWSIIVPLTWGTFSTMLILQLTSIFSAGGPILFFTGGKYNTNTISFWIFDQVRGGSYNYSSAVGIAFTLISIPIVFGLKWLMNKLTAEVTY